MESVARDMASKRITSIPEVPEHEKPTSEEWNIFHNKIRAIEAKMDVSNKIDPTKCANRYLAEEMEKNTEKLEYKKKVKRFIEIRRELKKEIAQDNKEYRNRLLGEKRNIMNELKKVKIMENNATIAGALEI